MQFQLFDKHKHGPKRRFLSNIDPLWTLVPVLALIAGGVWVERTINARWLALMQARTLYVTDLVTTKIQLSTLMQRAATDPILFANLNWQLNHSVNGALSGKLQKSQLDQLTLFDQDCNLLASAASGYQAPVVCPHQPTANITLGNYYWTTHRRIPTLWLATKIVGPKDAAIYMIGMVHIDDEWLAQHPPLRQAVNDLDLVIGHEDQVSGHLLLREGTDLNKQSLAVLSTTANIDRYLPLQENSNKPYNGRLLGPCLLFAFTLTVLALWRRQDEQRQQAAQQKDLRDWSAELVPLAQFTLPGKTVAQSKSSIEPFAATIKKNVQKSLQAQTASMRQHLLEKDELAARIAAKDEEIQRLKGRLSEFAELDSLALQLKRTSGDFLKRLAELQQTSTALAKHLEEQVVARAKTLAALLHEWQKGTNERGARKFLRSLSETPASQPGRTAVTSRLDEQLATLLALAQDVGHQALATTRETKALNDHATFATQIVRHWHGLALRTGELQSASLDLLDPIQDAQRLVSLEQDHQGLCFKNLLTHSDCGQIPAVPRTLWTTALYHVYLGLAEVAQGYPQITIASRMRRDQQRQLLVISIACEHEETLPKRGDKQSYHLEIAQSLLTPFGVSINVLPSLSGPFPIVMSWEWPRRLIVDNDKRLGKPPRLLRLGEAQQAQG